MEVKLEYLETDGWYHNGRIVICSDQGLRLGFPAKDFKLEVQDAPFDGGIKVNFLPMDGLNPLLFGEIRVDDSYESNIQDSLSDLGFDEYAPFYVKVIYERDVETKVGSDTVQSGRSE